MTPDIRLSPAGEPPAEQMAALHEEAAAIAYAHIFSTPFPLSEARDKWGGHHDSVWLAWRGPQLVGFATATGAELTGLYVLPREHGHGLGSALLDAVGDVRRLWVLEDNHSGRAWYENRGWRAAGEREEVYGVWQVLYER